MTRWPITLLLTCAVGVGLYLGYLYLKKVRRPGLVGLHLLLGAGSVEGLVAVLHGSSDTAYRAATPALIAACLFGYSVFSGFTRPLLGPEIPPHRRSHSDQPRHCRPGRVFVVPRLGDAALA